MNRKLKHLCSLLGLGVAFASPSVAQAYRMKLPWRGDSLPGNTYMTYAQTAHGTCPPEWPYCQLDLWAKRWDSSLGAWSESVTPGQATASNTPSDHVSWNMPIHSPVDGEVIACWRRMPDDDVNGDAVNCPGGGNNGVCMRAGNFVAIRTEDDMVVVLAHLKQDSISSELCPITTIYNYSNPVACTEFGDGWTKIVPSTVLTTPKPIRKGELVGRIGDSGAAAWPHLHMHVKPYDETSLGEPCLGYAEMLEFDEAWRQPISSSANADNDEWSRMDGSGWYFGSGQRNLLWSDPQGIRRDSIDVDVGISSSVMVTTTDPFWNTVEGAAVYINEDHNLEAVGFAIESDDTFTLGTIVERSTATAVDAATINPTAKDFVATIRNGSGKLQLVPYTFGANNSLIESTAGGYTSLTDVSIVKATTAPNHDGVTVAHKNTSTGYLQVSNFGATSLLVPNVDLRGSAISSSVVHDVDIARVVAGKALGGDAGTFRGVVTAERRGSDNAVVVRSWSISTNGMTVSQAGSVVASKASGGTLTASDVDISVVGNGSREFAVVSAREVTTDALWVQVYQISSLGTLTRLSEWDAGPISALSSVKVGDRDVAVGVVTGGSLSVLSFSVDANGILGRAGTRDAGPISAVALGATPFSEHLVAAVTNSAGNVELIHYITNYSTAL
ncbi:hypothetical protein [Polyangium sp. 15x6]|uniref:hypothetical protein n=1 Tax=Polyangium sp. 15x6 TaxID=3042687 RepID=UPI00249C6AD7|nr:hypothetical protein [Polyangium sp. 15x6]MDI3290837.1 hypothetical protein [Polyangium sp. 15x6]